MKRLLTLALGVAIGRAISKPDEAKAVLDKVIDQVRARTGTSTTPPQAYDSPAAPPKPAAQEASQPTPPPVAPDLTPPLDVVDEWSDESFPASDSPSGWAGRDHPRD